MCHECDDNEENMFEDDYQQPHALQGIPEEEVEEFLEFASSKFASVIEEASNRDVLYELITEWPKAKQAAFTLSTIIQSKIFEDDN